MAAKRKTRDKEEIRIEEFIAAEEELDSLKKQYGIEDDSNQKKGFIHRVASFFERQSDREKVAVNKKKYIIIALLTGWFGGHRFYVKHYKVAFLYLLFFWIGLGLYNTIIDLMIVIPMQPDENGNVLL